jgi:hypothetical protein
VASHYDFAIDLDVVTPARVNAIELRIDVPDVGATPNKPVAASLEDLPQRYVGEILERLNNRSPSFVLRTEGDRKLLHVRKYMSHSSRWSRTGTGIARSHQTMAVARRGPGPR